VTEFHTEIRNMYIILSVVLYGCKIWSLTFTEIYRLKTFDVKVLRKRLCLR
jgi:hypothetical protein